MSSPGISSSSIAPSRLERGPQGLGLLTPARRGHHDHPARAAASKVTRALIIARLNDGTRPFYALASLRRTSLTGPIASIDEIVAGEAANVPVVITGDFNCWRPLLRVLLPGWRTLARGRTWPAQRPHSQIDHILGRGPWVSHQSFTRDGGSDHLALIADIELR